MKIENLKIFLEVAQAESMNEAARNLFMSHQNLNKIIKNLESELNTQLFLRTNKGIQLTNSGKELFITANQIVKSYDKFLETLHYTESDIIKFYTLSSQSTLSNCLRSQQFGNRYLSIYKRDLNEIIKMIQRGKTGIYFLPINKDLAFSVAPETTKHVLFSSDRVTLICHKNYLEQYTGKSFYDAKKLLCNTAQNEFETAALNIDDIQLCKKLMRNEGFAYSTEYHLYCAEFTEDEWYIFHEESMPDYKIEFTLFFNLPNTAEFQKLQQDIIQSIEAFFFVTPNVK